MLCSIRSWDDRMATMLAALLQTIEQGLGPSLSLAGGAVFVAGLLLLAYLILAPALGVIVEMQAAGVGLVREWLMYCAHCRHMTLATGSECEHCGEQLRIPWTVRLRHFFGHDNEPRWLRTLRWIYTLLGVTAFALVSIAALLLSGAWSPQTSLEKLFVGLSLMTWGGLAWLLGRVFGIGTGGPISRVRDAVFSLALVAVLLATTTLASAARPVEETVVARVEVNGQVAQLGTQATALAGYQLGFEYLQIEHASVGFQHLTPLAVVGTQRIELPVSPSRKWITALLWKHAAGLGARGFTVRKRTDQFAVSRPGLYEIVLRGDQVNMRHYANRS